MFAYKMFPVDSDIPSLSKENLLKQDTTQKAQIHR